jgi:3-methyladenine DNA glycosylase AlkC
VLILTQQETRVINTEDSKESRRLTHELHRIRAHLLFFSSLLEDFKKSVIFILETPNPAMDSLPDDERLFSRKLLEKECNNLLIEIERFEKARQMQDKRLKNVMNLVSHPLHCRFQPSAYVCFKVFSSVNIDDSRRMQELTEAAVRDSAGESNYLRLPWDKILNKLITAMKQIAYLSMIFLPASFVAVRIFYIIRLSIITVCIICRVYLA